MFPRVKSEKYAYLVASTKGGLTSALRDVVAYGVVFGARGFKVRCILDVEYRELEQVKERMREEKVEATYTSDIGFLEKSLAHHAQKKTPVDVVVTISSHGWRKVGRDYILFGKKKILDLEIREWFASLPGSNIGCLVLVDTCHSGSMCEFPNSGESLPSPPALEENPRSLLTMMQAINLAPCIGTVCISACADSEMDRDDISDDFGFGGGLTTAFLDWIGSSHDDGTDGIEPFDVNHVFNYATMRLHKSNATPRLSWL